MSVTYPGQSRPALEGLDLHLARGTFFGLLGPNGAGKTTLISFLCGQLTGRYRHARIMGFAHSELSQFKRHLGYAPQEIALYPMLSARENLNFFAKMLDQPVREVDRVLDWVGLSARADDKVSAYSGGMQRRLNLGVALLNQPDLLILDEPTVGVDPESRLFIFERILELKRRGLTLIYSTHYLEEVEKICDEVGIVQHGKMRAQGNLRTLFAHGQLERDYLALTAQEPAHE